MENYIIGITTFSKRFDYLDKLLSQIRLFSDNKIVIAINGESDGNFDEDYRVSVLNLCAKYVNIYPTFYLEIRGLSKLWNTILINSCETNVLMLNDDIEIHSGEIFKITSSLINSTAFSGLTKMNNSFSHFVVSKKLMCGIGYFDERLLGFGEEDGDITYRLLKSGIVIGGAHVGGVVNIVSNVRHDEVKSGIGKYSLFNRDFIYKEKYLVDMSSKYKGMFDTPMGQKLPDINSYPCEKFFMENKDRL